MTAHAEPQPRKSLATSLEDLRRTPLDKIQPDQADEIVRDILKRGTIQAPVEVARFGSAI